MTPRLTARHFAFAFFALAISWSGAAQAQFGGSGGGNTSGGLPNMNMIPQKVEDPAVLEQREKVDQAYRDSLRKQSLQAPAAVDPWSNMRGNEPAKPAAQKPAAKKPAQ